MGYAITSNRIGSSELNENAFQGSCIFAGSLNFAKEEIHESSSHFNVDNFIFIIKANSQSGLKCDFLCCSIFEKGECNYEANQRPRTLMKKERIHILSNTTDILLDRLSAQTKPENTEKSSVTESQNTESKSDDLQ